jgi:hypothetical protein
MYLRELGCEDVNWMEPAKSRVQGKAFLNPVMKFGFCISREFHRCCDTQAQFFFPNFEETSQEYPV